MKETVKEATVERVVSLSKKAGSTVGTFVRNSSRGPGGLLERFRRNPVPMAIAGIEVAAIILKELKQFRPERTERPASVNVHEPTPAVPTQHTARNSARFLVIAAGTACLTTWAIWKLGARQMLGRRMTFRDERQHLNFFVFWCSCGFEEACTNMPVGRKRSMCLMLEYVTGL